VESHLDHRRYAIPPVVVPRPYLVSATKKHHRSHTTTHAASTLASNTSIMWNVRGHSICGLPNPRVRVGEFNRAHWLVPPLVGARKEVSNQSGYCQILPAEEPAQRNHRRADIPPMRFVAPLTSQCRGPLTALLPRKDRLTAIPSSVSRLFSSAPARTRGVFLHKL
jgi:hypothetical protein